MDSNNNNKNNNMWLKIIVAALIGFIVTGLIGIGIFSEKIYSNERINIAQQEQIETIKDQLKINDVIEQRLNDIDSRLCRIENKLFYK